MNQIETREREKIEAALPTTGFLRDPLLLVGSLVLVALLVYFFGFIKIFVSGHQSAAVWAWQAWNPEGDYEHAKLIPFIAGFLVWHERHKLRAAPIGSSRWG